MIGHIHTDQGFYARGLLRSLPPLIRRTTLTSEYETANVRTPLCSGATSEAKAARNRIAHERQVIKEGLQ